MNLIRTSFLSPQHTLGGVVVSEAVMVSSVTVSPYLPSQAVQKAEQQGLLHTLLRGAEQKVHVVTKLLPPRPRQRDTATVKGTQNPPS